MTISDILLILSLTALVFIIIMRNLSKNNKINDDVSESVNNDESENSEDDTNDTEDDGELTAFDKSVWRPIIERPWRNEMIDDGMPNYRDAWKNY
jgi:hypothetical protein